MLIVNKEFDSFRSGVEFLKQIGSCINTPYLNFDSTSFKKFVNSYVEIQLNRRFNKSMSNIDLYLGFNQNRLRLAYNSTSETEVFFNTYFNNEMEVERVEISVDLDEERCKRGRTHYEAITQLVYQYDWDYQKDNSYIQQIAKGRNRIIDDNILPVPNWLLNQVSNGNVWIGHYQEINKLFDKFGFWVDKPVKFTLNNWTNKKGDMIVEIKKHPHDNRFQIIKTGRNYYPETLLSYRELILKLKQQYANRTEAIENV